MFNQLDRLATAFTQPSAQKPNIQRWPDVQAVQQLSAPSP
jgi:hypothetical protein